MEKEKRHERQQKRDGDRESKETEENWRRSSAGEKPAPPPYHVTPWSLPPNPSSLLSHRWKQDREESRRDAGRKIARVACAVIKVFNIAVNGGLSPRSRTRRRRETEADARGGGKMVSQIGAGSFCLRFVTTAAGLPPPSPLGLLGERGDGGGCWCCCMLEGRAGTLSQCRCVTTRVSCRRSTHRMSSPELQPLRSLGSSLNTVGCLTPKPL
ncbi:uncharacterized protein DS421_16g552260 [Arachis hypogaea]|nr:uncharacterized protein DS421_16g552260 [Arachis hypogaea]